MIKHAKCYIKDYPRPQLVREQWQSLNGKWGFTFGDGKNKDKCLRGGFTDTTITVPFDYECKSSGIADESFHDSVWYQLKTTINKQWAKKQILIHFEGADYITKLYVNGNFVGQNEGAYHRFSFDITSYLCDGENLIVVNCLDNFCSDIPRGKQRWQNENFGCWYVQTTGIYKSVWLEAVNEVNVSSLKITPNLANDTIEMNITPSKVDKSAFARVKISHDGMLIKEVGITLGETDNIAHIDLRSNCLPFETKYWSPQCPDIYDLDIKVFNNENTLIDSVSSYFGIREIKTVGDKFLLNSVPYIQKLILDQGYWQDSHLTPPDEAALIKDIQLVKAMGFNGVRKHQKIEDERFLYLADVMGLVVWGEMPSSYWYSDNSVQRTSEQWQKIVRQNYNHPSIFCWVPFNESWGVKQIFASTRQQNFTTAIYYLTKSIDDTRPVISNDGWEHTISDILTIHDYTQDSDKLKVKYDSMAKLSGGYAQNMQKLPYALGHSYNGQPIIISEFGGTALVRDAKNSAWGYGVGAGGEDELLQRLTLLINTVMAMPSCSGLCYTQITDIQQEVNGLLDMARNAKIPLQKIKEVLDRI